jgi:hypothetical protein
MAINRRYFHSQAVEEIMPRAIKVQQITEKTVVIVLTTGICLMLVSAGMEVTIKLVLP